MALDEIAMREWRRLAGVLRERNTLHEIDHGSLAAYCQMYSRWVAAEKALARMALALAEQATLDRVFDIALEAQRHTETGGAA